MKHSIPITGRRRVANAARTYTLSTELSLSLDKEIFAATYQLNGTRGSNFDSQPGGTSHVDGCARW